MKVVSVILEKGPNDFSAWVEDIKGLYGAGRTQDEALENLKEAMALYVKHNKDAPAWLKNKEYKIRIKISPR